MRSPTAGGAAPGFRSSRRIRVLSFWRRACQMAPSPPPKWPCDLECEDAIVGVPSWALDWCQCHADGASGAARDGCGWPRDCNSCWRMTTMPTSRCTAASICAFGRRSRMACSPPAPACLPPAPSPATSRSRATPSRPPSTSCMPTAISTSGSATAPTWPRWPADKREKRRRRKPGPRRLQSARRAAGARHGSRPAANRGRIATGARSRCGRPPPCPPR